MKIIPSILLPLILLCSCKEKGTKQIDFCNMLKLDQSYVNTDVNDKEFKSDGIKRNDIFKSNFEELVKYFRSQGFPEIGPLKNVTGIDSCRNWAVKMTLFHVGQSQPHLLFQPHVIEVLTKEIKEGRLKSGKLSGAIWEGFGGFKFCISQKEIMHNALKNWGYEVSELPEIRFIDCEDK